MKTNLQKLMVALRSHIASMLIVILIGQINIVLAQRVERNEMLQNFSERKTQEFNREKSEAIRLADSLGLEVRVETDDGRVIELMRFENGMPVYYSTRNLVGAQTISTDKVWPGGGAGLALNGSGEILRIWDGGRVRDTHQEFGSRVTNVDGGSLSFHATHVAGTMIASGVFDSAQGMAGQAMLRAFDWNNDIAEMAQEAASGMLVSNHSYGVRRGWVQSGGIWYWYGDINISATEDYLFGFYDKTAKLLDSLAHMAPDYTIVWAAGNDRARSALHLVLLIMYGRIMIMGV
jgi:hypothetical protein